MSSRKNHEGPDALEYLEKDEGLIEEKDFKGKEAFEKWFTNAQYSTNDDLLRLRFLEAWQAACEYKELEIKAYVNHLIDCDDEIGRLKKEVGDLKQKLEAAEKIKSR
jgi:hypothetical protein